MSSKEKTSSKPNQSRDYEVGFGKPPKSTQFKPGNRGRKAPVPKGEVNVTSVFRAIAAEKISLTVGGQLRKIRFDQAVLVANQQRALEGHPAASRNINKFLDMGGFMPTLTPDMDSGPKVLVPAFEGTPQEFEAAVRRMEAKRSAKAAAEREKTEKKAG